MEIEEIEMLIYKYLSKKITPEEERCLLDWLNTSPESMQLFGEMEAVHRALNFYWIHKNKTDKSTGHLIS